MDKYKSDKRESAKHLLLHYFKTVSIEPLDYDCQSEIEYIVDLIIDAAVVETIKELRDIRINENDNKR